MNERMSKEKRREQLLEIMRDLRSKAKTKSEFTADLIAEEAKVSSVWVYRLVCAEFGSMRESLPGPRRSPKGVEYELRREIAELHQRLKDLEARYIADVMQDFGAAIKHIEALDAEVRLLRGIVEVLEHRLKEAGEIVDLDKYWGDPSLEMAQPSMEKGTDNPNILDEFVRDGLFELERIS